MFWITWHFRTNVEYSKQVWMMICVKMLEEFLTVRHLFIYLFILTDSRGNNWNKPTWKVLFEPLESVLCLEMSSDKKELFWTTVTRIPKFHCVHPKNKITDPIFGYQRIPFAPLPRGILPSERGFGKDSVWTIKVTVEFWIDGKQLSERNS